VSRTLAFKAYIKTGQLAGHKILRLVSMTYAIGVLHVVTTCGPELVYRYSEPRSDRKLKVGLECVATKAVHNRYGLIVPISFPSLSDCAYVATGCLTNTEICSENLRKIGL